MALKLEGRLVGVIYVPPSEAKGEYAAKEASGRLDVYDKDARKEGRNRGVKCSLAAMKVYEDLEGELVSLPITDYVYGKDRGGADVSYTLIEDKTDER